MSGEEQELLLDRIGSVFMVRNSMAERKTMFFGHIVLKQYG